VWAESGAVGDCVVLWHILSLKADDRALLRTLRQLNPMADWNGGSHEDDGKDDYDEE
jgi:hypothetical protein